MRVVGFLWMGGGFFSPLVGLIRRLFQDLTSLKIKPGEDTI